MRVKYCLNCPIRPYLLTLLSTKMRTPSIYCRDVLFSLLILLPPCRPLAITPSPSTSLILPSPASRSTLNLSDSSADSQCVSTGKYPEWNGHIRYEDCKRVLSALRTQTASTADDLFAFYTHAGGFKPPPGLQELNWPLPTTMTYGTCVFQVRMFRDFKEVEIPTEQGEWLIPSGFAPAQITTWRALLKEVEGVLRCIKLGEPGWGSEGLRPIRQKPKQFGDIGVFFWGYTSEMAHDYADVMPKGVIADGNEGGNLTATS